MENPRENSFASLMFVNETKNRTVVFSYFTSNRFGKGSLTPVRLKGLDPRKKYTVKEINLYPGTESTLEANLVFSGEFLMTIGFNPQVNASRTSVILELTEMQ